VEAESLPSEHGSRIRLHDFAAEIVAIAVRQQGGSGALSLETNYRF
jgi:hypothetical protein